MKKDLWQRAEELFHAALEQSPEARRSFLDKACGEDAELRRQVETLLSQDEQAGSFLEKPALAGTTETPGARGSLVGRQFGPYRILSSLGAGGMGEVYRAHDSKLGRDVAVKTLTPQFSGDPERIARFQREAKLLASLNHPNIAAIYGLEESGETNFLVLELVEGATLADYIAGNAGVLAGKGAAETAALPGILNIALQIAEALEAAHEKGVIHRDLKPANIKVTPDGKVKVLDFGLAKAFAVEQADLNLSNSPTLSFAATQQGVILGTAAYMSPEQAKGKTVDKKADIWAFGCVLYEMLTGQAAFQGEDVTEILAAVVKGGANLDLLPANLHPRVREVLTRCLQKDLKKRYHDIADVRYEIEQSLADPSEVLVQPTITAEPRGKSRIMLWVSVAVVLVVIAAGLTVWKLKPSEPRQVMRFDFDLPEGQQVNGLAVSPNGIQFVYSTSKGLYLRSVDEWTSKIIAGTEGDTQHPFFSPDGKWIAYFSVADHMLKKISTDGGPPAIICDVAQIQGASWCEDDTIVFGQMPGDIMRISVKGGTPESLIKAKTGFPGAPQILPDGKSVLYSSTTGGADPKILVQSLKSGKSKELFPGIYAQYLPTGHIAYFLANNNNLLVVPFDIDKLEVTGGSVPIIAGVLRFAIANNGTMIYLPGSAMANANNQRILVWVDRKGNEEAVDAEPKFYKYPNVSPDGTKVAVTDYATGKIHDIWIWDLIRKTLTKLTSEGKENVCPVWSPDGKRIAFCSIGRGKNGNVSGVYLKAADGTGRDEQLSSIPDGGFFPYCWSSDGKFLVGVEIPASMNYEHIGLLSMEGDHARKPLVQEASVERSAKISPDGRWMAYTSNESGRQEIYVRSFPDVNKGKWQVSNGGGGGPLWSPDGRELFYLSGDAVMAVSVKTEPNFNIIGIPQVLFKGTFVRPEIGEGTPWALSRDGKRFLMLKRQVATSATSTAAAPRKINVVLNWIEELKQRVPGSKN